MKKLLIVVDMQNDFIDGSLGSAEALAIVPRVAEKIRGWDGELVFTLDTHGEGYLETNEGRHLPVRHCIKGERGHKLAPEIEAARAGRGVIMEKPSFGSLSLADMLREKNYDEVTLVGLCTDICVISNAMIAKAALPEADVYVDASCCAGVTQNSHKNALSAMAACQIGIINDER